MSLCMIRTALAISMCVSVAACSSQVDSQKPIPSTGGTNSATAGQSSGGSGTAGSGFGQAGSGFAQGGTGFGQAGSGGSVSGGSSSTGGTGSGGTGIVIPMCGMPQGAETPLPLAIDPSFVPSGYFAGPLSNTTGIVESACEARPAEHTVGVCHKFTFQAATLEGEGAYGGVFWQYGANNWGMAPGMKVAAGATKVRFKAWGVAGGEVVKFSAGGIGSVTSTCSDTVNLGMDGGTSATLTTTPTEYEVDLLGQTYPNGIIGGFVWSTAVTTVEEVVSFYVDEIQWVAE